MSLKIRIVLLFGLLVFLGLAADIGLMMFNARARVQAESEAMGRVTRDFVEAAVANLQASADPEKSLHQLTQSLDSLRHVRIAFVRNFESAPATMLSPDDDRREAPSWFSRCIPARNSVTVLPVFIDERKFGDIVIASDSSDEINEVWEDVRNLALIGGAIALGALLGASFILGRTLRPLEHCAQALRRLRDGDYGARVETAGSPEFVDLCAKINALAEALQTLSIDNRDLFQRLMDVQEDERKKIAHELHDEIGPYLFALRANTTVLETGLKDTGQEALQRRVVAIRDQIESLQAHNKRIFRQLRPPALDDLGLCEALKILVEGWRDTDPDVDVQLCLPKAFAIKDEKKSLALYRLAQEALTNIHRHAKATHATVALSVLTAPPEIRLLVQDDGIGIDPAKPMGLGLAGMQERVRALGGQLSFKAAPYGGGIVEASIPI